MNTAEQRVPGGRPEETVSGVWARKMPEVEKLRRARGKLLYNYGRDGPLDTEPFNLRCPLLPRYG
jgi:hypothetical protein